MKDLRQRLQLLPVPARKLLCVIARQTYHGALRSKDPGIATMPEVHEACGLDVDQMYSVLQILRDSRFVDLKGEYPFEEIQVLGMEALFRRCEAAKIPIENFVVDAPACLSDLYVLTNVE